MEQPSFQGGEYGRGWQYLMRFYSFIGKMLATSPDAVRAMIDQENALNREVAEARALEAIAQDPLRKVY